MFFLRVDAISAHLTGIHVISRKAAEVVSYCVDYTSGFEFSTLNRVPVDQETARQHATADARKRRQVYIPVEIDDPNQWTGDGSHTLLS